MIVLTGANGQLGRAIAERLLHLPPSQLGVSVRDPAQAGWLAERGVRVRQGSFDDAASLRHAFEGAAQVLIISSNTAGDATVDQHRTAIEAAKAVGARRILYTSHMGSHASSLFAPMRDHAATEALLETCGVPFTSLRNGFYATSAMMFVGRALEVGELAAAEDGPVSWTTHADLADAAVIALTDEGRLHGLTPALTASSALDLADLAAIASEESGREIKRVVITDEKQRAGMLAAGVPKGRVELLMGMFAASRKGEFAAVDPTLERLLGRPPQSMREVLRAKRY